MQALYSASTLKAHTSRFHGDKKFDDNKETSRGSNISGTKIVTKVKLVNKHVVTRCMKQVNNSLFGQNPSSLG